MNSQSKCEIFEDDYDIDSLCVEEYVEEVEIVPTENDASPAEVDVQLSQSIVNIQQNTNTSIIYQKRKSEPEARIDGSPNATKKIHLSAENDGTISQCCSDDFGWKIADELFADENNHAAAVAIPSKIISDLPEEVLEEIMKWHSCTDRKNVKLVCKHWFSVCSRIFDSKEKICVTLHNDLHLDDVLSVLLNSTRKFLHLEFYGSDFSAKPRALFWKACGPRILSLKLCYCALSGPSFANILKSCTNLQTLELDFRNIHFDLKKKIQIINPNETLTEDLKNTSLKTLKVSFSIDFNYVVNRLYVVNLVDRFFQFFPNMSDFSLRHRSLLESVWVTTSPYGNFYEGSYDYQMLDLAPINFVRRRMENVAINYFLLPGLTWHSFLTKAEKLMKITEIAVDLGGTIDMKSLKEFMEKQIHLRSITCAAIKRVREALLVEAIDVMWKVPSLREFQLVFRNIIHWNASYSTLLSTSNIESLRIFCREINFSKMKNNPQAFHPKLISLAVQAIKAYDSSIVLVLKAFPNLKELYLSHVNNTILESVCCNQVKLHSFHVQSVVGPLDSVNLVREWKQLRRLEIPQSDVLLEVGSFNRLKHLHVCKSYLHESRDGATFSIFKDTSFSLKHLRTYFCPSLETIRLDTYIKPEYPAQFVETVAEFVSGLKYLKFLSFCRLVTTRIVTIHDLSTIFQRCPSLEVLIVENHAYFKDVIEGRIRTFVKKSNWDANFNEYELVTKYMNLEADRHQWDFFFHRVSPYFYQSHTF